MENIIILQERNATLYEQTYLTRYHTYEDRFTEEDGLQIAIGFVDPLSPEFTDSLNRTIDQ